jgi:peroxiredoxin
VSAAFYIAFGALSAVVIFHTLVLLGLTRALHNIQQSEPVDSEPTGLTGQQVPDFTARALTGEIIDREYLVGHETALLFVSPDCGTCSVTLSELDALNLKTNGRTVVFCRSTSDRCSQLADTYRLNVPVVVDDELDFSGLFAVAGAPTAVLIGADGQVLRYGQPMSGDDLHEMVLTTADGNQGEGL